MKTMICTCLMMIVMTGALMAQGTDVNVDCTELELPRNGDLTGDGVVTANDAQMAMWIAVTTGTNFQVNLLCSADCDGDGVVTEEDVTSIFLRVLSLETCIDG